MVTTVTMVRGRRWLLGIGTLTILLILAAWALWTDTPVTPAAVPAPVSTRSAAAQQPQPARAADVARHTPAGVRHDYIVQASSIELARSAVERAGGVITGEIGIIRAVGAALDERELAALWEEPVAGLRVYEDRKSVV